MMLLALFVFIVTTVAVAAIGEATFGEKRR